MVCLFLSLCLAFQLSAQDVGKRFNATFQNESMSSALKRISKLSGVRVIFAYEDVNAFRVSTVLRNVTAEQAVRAITRNYPLNYVLKDNGKYISVTRRKNSTPTRGATKPADDDNALMGRVVDEQGEPLMGATINVKYAGEDDLFTTTDMTGMFRLKRQGGELSISASFVGYEKKTLKVRRDQNNYQFRLSPGLEGLDEVVVTGIFNKPKVSFTGAATVITKEQIASSGNRNLLKTISNIDPSFDIQEANDYGSNPNQQLNIEVRGSSTLGDVRNLQNNIRNQYNLPLFILDGFEVSSERVMDMNQDDVESVVLLKDASATAIYGSRGANGVMVITSKRPDYGKLRVSYSMGLNLEIPDLSSYDLLNSFEKIEVEKLAGFYTGTSLSDQIKLDAIYNENLRAANEGVNTDWLGKPLRVGVGQYHKLGLSGGTDEFRYTLDLSYNGLNGVMKGSKRDNINGIMSINYIMKKVRLSNQLSIGINNAANSPYGTFSTYAYMNPYWRPYDETGAPIPYFNALGSTYPTVNPLYDAAQTSFSTTDYLNVRETMMLDIDLMKNLRLNLSAGFSQQRGQSDYFRSPKASDYVITSSYPVGDRGMYQRSNNQQNSWQVGGTINWAKVFNEKHSVYIGFNGQMMETGQEDTSWGVRGFMNDALNDLSNANKYADSTPRTSETTTRSIGFTATGNYSFMQRYFADFSYRLDGASSFGKNSRWAPFWSVGLGWEFAQEKLVRKLLPFFTLGKLRYSYGVTGTLGFAPYEALTTYQYIKDAQYNYLVGANIIGFGNPNLKWQATKQHNIGLDLGLFNGRLSFNFNYYRKTTSNLLADAGLPLSHGYVSYKENLGVMRNTGYDLLMSYTFLRLPDKQIDWSVRAGAYHNDNILVKLSEAMKKYNEQQNNNQLSSSSTFYQYREGQSIDEIYALRSIGINPESGKRLYVADDGTVTTNKSGIKPVPVGVEQPKINGRLGTAFRWQGLMIDLNFSIRWGGKKLNQTLLSRVENANIKGGNVDRRVLTLRWQKPGDHTAYKGLGNTDNTMANDLFVFTERTMTFSMANITWELPRKWITPLSLQRLAFTASMQDIFYISNIEQERGTDYPYSRQPMFQVSCTF